MCWCLTGSAVGEELWLDFLFLLQLCCPLVENVNFYECSLKQDCFISLLQSCNETHGCHVFLFLLQIPSKMDAFVV